MELYYIGLHHIETAMKNQFDLPENPTFPERPAPRREHPTTTRRTRLAIGAALYRLARAIDPAAPVPSRQH